MFPPVLFSLAIIPYQELSGSYNSGRCAVCAGRIIPYQELSGSYNSLGRTTLIYLIIPYQELSGSYNGRDGSLDLPSAFMLPQGNAVHKTQATSLPANWIFGKAIWQRRKRPTLRSLYRPLWMVTPRSANCCWKFWALCSAIIAPKQSLCFAAPATAAKVCWRISCVGFWVSLLLHKSRICETSRCVGRLAISKGKSYWSAQNARTSPSAWMPVPSSRPSQGNLS